MCIRTMNPVLFSCKIIGLRMNKYMDEITEKMTGITTEHDGNYEETDANDEETDGK